MATKTLADYDLAISQDAELEANLEDALAAALHEVHELRVGMQPDYASRVDGVTSRLARMHKLLQDVKAEDIHTAPTAAAVAGGAVRSGATPAPAAIPAGATNTGTGATGGPSPTKPAVVAEEPVTTPHGAVLPGAATTVANANMSDAQYKAAASADPGNPTPLGAPALPATGDEPETAKDTIPPVDPDGELAQPDGEPVALGEGNSSAQK